MIAFISPKRRKSHLATEVGTQWFPLCDVNPAPLDGTPFLSIDAAKATVSTTDPTVCIHCLRMIAFVHVLEHLDATGDGTRHLMAVAS